MKLFFKTGLWKMQADIFFFIRNWLYRADMTGDRNVMERRR